MTRVVGFVVAGGGSTRMGSDKALLPWRGTTLLDDAVRRLREVTDDVRLLTGPHRRYEDRGLVVLPDETPGLGPLVGVATALRAMGSGTGIFLAVDLPGIPSALLRSFLEWSRGADAVVPISNTGPEPLCAAYRTTCLPAIERQFRDGQYKMTNFWGDITVRKLQVAELARFGPVEAMFLNVNTPEAYSKIQEESRPQR